MTVSSSPLDNFTIRITRNVGGQPESVEFALASNGHAYVALPTVNNQTPKRASTSSTRRRQPQRQHGESGAHLRDVSQTDAAAINSIAPPPQNESSTQWFDASQRQKPATSSRRSAPMSTAKSLATSTSTANEKSSASYRRLSNWRRTTSSSGSSGGSGHHDRTRLTESPLTFSTPIAQRSLDASSSRRRRRQQRLQESASQRARSFSLSNGGAKNEKIMNKNASKLVQKKPKKSLYLAMKKFRMASPQISAASTQKSHSNRSSSRSTERRGRSRSLTLDVTPSTTATSTKTAAALNSSISSDGGGNNQAPTSVYFPTTMSKIGAPASVYFPMTTPPPSSQQQQPTTPPRSPLPRLQQKSTTTTADEKSTASFRASDYRRIGVRDRAHLTDPPIVFPRPQTAELQTAAAVATATNTNGGSSEKTTTEKKLYEKRCKLTLHLCADGVPVTTDLVINAKTRNPNAQIETIELWADGQQLYKREPIRPTSGLFASSLR